MLVTEGSLLFWGFVPNRISEIGMFLSSKEKQLSCTVIKRGSETLVSCYEVQMGLVPCSSARCWSGVGGGAWLAWPGHWHHSLVTGPGQTAVLVPLMGLALPVAAVAPLAPTQSLDFSLPIVLFFPQLRPGLGPEGLRASVTVARLPRTTLGP